MNKHRQRSQSRLHDLFPGFAKFLSSHIEKTCYAVLNDPLRSTDEPLRILDLGCGTVPYANVFEEVAKEFKGDSGPGVEIVLIDKDANLSTTEIQGCTTVWSWVDVLDLAEELRTQKRSTIISGPFDVVILAASLHEFYFDAVSKMCKSWVPATFHQEFLNALCLEGVLVAPRHGRVIIADYAWEDEAPPEHLEQIADHQFNLAEHADPPWSFASIFQIIGCMNAIGYRIQSSDRRGLYDQLNDTQIREMFAGLQPEVRETLRMRSGFVLTFKREPSAKLRVSHSFTIQPTILHLSYAVEQMFKESLNLEEWVIRDKLNNIFIKPEAKDKGLSPLVRLAQQIYQDSKNALKTQRATDPGACEIWFGIGLRKFRNSRFIPSLRRWWMPNEPPAAGGVFLRHADDTIGERQCGLAGAVTIAFDSLLNSSSPSLMGAGIQETPSIHNWCVRLHRAIRDNVRERPASPESPVFRSLTILSPSATWHDHAISAAWADDEQQRITGHYILRLCPETLDPSSPTSLAERVREQLDRISYGVAQTAVSWLPTAVSDVQDKNTILWLYSAFLTVIFGLGDQHQIDHTIEELRRLRKPPKEEKAEQLNSVLDGTIERLRDYSKVVGGKEDFPRYRSYTTLAFGCDGLSTANPDTLMIFSERPLPPSALVRISRYTSDVFRRIVQAESEIIVERQAQTQSDLDATRRLIRAFGHDGKTPAALIEGVLTDEDFTLESRIAISKALSSRLIERLGGYRWLISEEKDQRQIRRSLWSQVSEFGAKWKGVDEIWIDAISMTILAVCVREDDKWGELREWLNIEDLERRRTIVNFMDDPQKMINSVNNFKQVSNTFGLKTPFSLRRKEGGESTTGSPLVYHALRLIFSEIITNAFRHELPFADQSEPITMSLNASIDKPEQEIESQQGAEPVLAQFDITILPAATNLRDSISRDYNGLLSMKDACIAMGSTIVTRAVPVKSQSDGEYVPLELPYFKRHDGGITWTLKGIPLFL